MFITNYNYSSNIFFQVNNYYVYLLNPQNTLNYNFYYENYNYFLQIKNKEKQPLNIYFKIIDINNKCFYYTLYRNKNNLIKLIQFHKLGFTNNHKDYIYINSKIIDYIHTQYPNLNVKYYNQNLFNIDYNILDEKNYFFLKYNWFYFGRFNKFQYWKYILYKNNIVFEKLKQKIDYKLTYNHKKEYTLLFIDTRYDKIFINILITFLYSVNNDWNLKIYTTKENEIKYIQCLQKNFGYENGIHYQIKIIQTFHNILDYSNLLKSPDFWESFSEKYVLLFQYDSLAFSKFNNDFLNNHYLGAQWPVHIQQIKDIYNGNGGTSLRNIQTMKFITNKYNYKLTDEKTPEDKYFSTYLQQEKLLNNDPILCNQFSFENVYNTESIYGHAIYESVNLNDLEEYIINRFNKIIL